MSSKKKGLAETFIKNEERLQQSEQQENVSPAPTESNRYQNLIRELAKNISVIF